MRGGLAAAVGVGVVLAVVATGAAAAPLVTFEPRSAPIHVPPGVSATDKRTVTVRAGVKYTITISGTVTAEYKGASPPFTCVHDALYGSCQGKPFGGGVAGGLATYLRGSPYFPVPYTGAKPPVSDSHVYTLTWTPQENAELTLWATPRGEKSVYEPTAYSGGFDVTFAGQAASEIQTVSFVFTQGGRPKAAPRDLIDVRTAGRGSITFVNDDPDEPERVLFTEIKNGTAQVVPEMDFAVHPDLKLTFRLRQPVKSIDLYQAEDRDPSLGLGLDLEIASSNDRDCPPTKGGKPRTALLHLRDGAGKKPDAISLVVTGCPHHNASFKGTLGKGSRVNVAIVHKR